LQRDGYGLDRGQESDEDRPSNATSADPVRACQEEDAGRPIDGERADELADRERNRKSKQ
jgi:hypothetical protein